MNRALVSLLLCLLLAVRPVAGAGSQNAPAPPRRLTSNQAPPDTVILLQREACERRCSVYRLVIFDDGTVVWQGIAYVQRMGVALGSIDTRLVKELVADAKAMNFFSLKNGYGVVREYDVSPDFEVSDEKCISGQPDAPLAMLTISTGGLSKAVINDRTCKGGTYDKLTALEDKIVAITNSDRWIMGSHRAREKAGQSRNVRSPN